MKKMTLNNLNNLKNLVENNDIERVFYSDKNLFGSNHIEKGGRVEVDFEDKKEYKKFNISIYIFNKNNNITSNFQTQIRYNKNQTGQLIINGKEINFNIEDGLNRLTHFNFEMK